MHIETITLYSVGLLGGSFGLGLKATGFKGTIIGLSSPAAVETAKKIGAIDEGYGYDRLEQVLQKTDLLVICSPILAIKECLKKLSSMKCPDGLIVTDVGSTKKEITQLANQVLPSTVRFIGGHPMAGSEKSGPGAADPYLFQNAIYVITPRSGQPDEMELQFASFLDHYLGSRHIFLAPDIHDCIAATVSHVPHLLAVALVNVARKTENCYPGTLSLAAGGFRDLTRIASSPYRMWHDILFTNKAVVDSVLDTCIRELQQMKEQLRSDSLQDAFDTASQTRSAIPSRNKGFISALHEVLVMTKDQPGIIATIATTMTEHDINIKDIEVLKVREGEGGTIRLGFESAATAKTAARLLRDKGFSARERI
ncbi:MAG: prephenate dehydrogenase/arogenate dehydrogenase family protein [Chitinivibrionales bacterium]